MQVRYGIFAIRFWLFFVATCGITLHRYQCVQKTGQNNSVVFVTYRIFNLYAGDLGIENVEDLSVEGAHEDDRHHEVQYEDEHVVLGSRPRFHRRQVLCADGHIYLQFEDGVLV